ncbi:hypothetical protein C5C27_06335 [Rathayibacter sp. AY2B7]|nr:hypothetical protein C5C26_11520 [Rathayibacter sp. AY2B1]PPG63077.1 hypothetical protein C5C27_06335 [Rathayibacter sp. AY2B7]PPG72826.1 hypothetical protein C5C59_04895 [Rathayibacter sp. AY1F4]
MQRLVEGMCTSANRRPCEKLPVGGGVLVISCPDADSDSADRLSMLSAWDGSASGSAVGERG